MKFTVFSVAFAAVLLAGTAMSLAQGNGGDCRGSCDFPLAAKAGQISGARQKPLPGAVNQGPFDAAKWKYGHAFDPPAGAKIWNPVKLKMMQGGKITSGSIAGNSDPATYCAMANAGYDFIWTEMQHAPGTWDSVSKMWGACPHAKAIPGVRLPNANEFDEQHAMDGGALWLEVPTVRSLDEAKLAVKWAYFPPMGGRSAGGSSDAFWGQVPGGYRNTINDNLILTVMIETLAGLGDSDKIAALPGITAVFAASSDLGNHSGYKAGDPDYEREINMVHDSALMAHKYLCGPFAWLNRPDFKCFQGPGNVIRNPVGNINAAYEAAAKKALGPLWNTQGKPEVGPYAPGWKPEASARRAR